jgi:hypothetical protein
MLHCNTIVVYNQEGRRMIFQTDIHAVFGVFHAIVVIGFGERADKDDFSN